MNTQKIGENINVENKDSNDIELNDKCDIKAVVPTAKTVDKNGENIRGDLEEYRDVFELLMRKPDVDIICGADLGKSIFSGYPGAFLGIGNCLVTTRESGKADVTYVNEDSSLTLPMPIVYPNDPTVMESIIYLNALPADR